MKLYEIYGVLIGIIIILYGIPFVAIKGKKRVYFTLIIGTVLFYVFSGIFVCLMNAYNWDNGQHGFSDLVVLALFVSMPFVLIVNIILALLYYLICKEKKEKNVI